MHNEYPTKDTCSTPIEFDIKEAIQKRKSVRTFDGEPITAEDEKRLSEYLQTLKNPFGVSVEFRFLDADVHDLSSPVIVGTDSYIAAKVSRGPQFEIAYGYSFEALCLYAASIGVGTVMLGGTFNRKAFEKAMELADSEVMPLASPLGYPAKKRSVREKLMRGAIKADERLPFEKLFFENSFGKSLTPQTAGKFQSALEMVQLAPSAVNKQPWRAVVCGDTVHFFKKGKGMSTGSFDLQRIDIGIALAHFDLTLKEEGIDGRFLTKEPDFEVDRAMEYVISYEL